jgi:hypothetical protein
MPDRTPSVTAGLPASDRRRRQKAVAFLVRRGAAVIPHLNGSLLDHLERTERRLRDWECSETVAMAGLCHAAYGTDGFATFLVSLERRWELGEVVGPEVDALVYLYASCDRNFVYPSLREGVAPTFRDRFNGRVFEPGEHQLRAFIDLTLANEADVGMVGPGVLEPPGWLRSLFEQIGTRASDSVQDGFNRLISRP